jgi:hypothetical protein
VGGPPGEEEDGEAEGIPANNIGLWAMEMPRQSAMVHVGGHHFARCFLDAVFSLKVSGLRSGPFSWQGACLQTNTEERLRQREDETHWETPGSW